MPHVASTGTVFGWPILLPTLGFLGFRTLCISLVTLLELSGLRIYIYIYVCMYNVSLCACVCVCSCRVCVCVCCWWEGVAGVWVLGFRLFFQKVVHLSNVVKLFKKLKITNARLYLTDQGLSA